MSDYLLLTPDEIEQAVQESMTNYTLSPYQSIARKAHSKILAELKMIRDGEEYALSFRQAIEAMIQRMERE